jgi:hypothetical protein
MCWISVWIVVSEIRSSLGEIREVVRYGRYWAPLVVSELKYLIGTHKDSVWHVPSLSVCRSILNGWVHDTSVVVVAKWWQR